MENDTRDQGGLRIRQMNVCKSLVAQLEALNNFKDRFDIICFQEQHFDFQQQSRALRNWYTIYPTRGERDGEERQRSMMLVNRKIATDTWEQLDIPSKDITAIELKTSSGKKVRIFNIYNDILHSEVLDDLSHYLRQRRRDEGRREAEEQGYDLWMGDFNRHHPHWDDPRQSQLFTTQNLTAAQKLLDLTAEYGMEMILPTGIPTRRDWASLSLTRPDNVFCVDHLVSAVVKCDTMQHETPPTTDHFPIDTTLDFELLKPEEEAKRNFRETDWEKFRKELETRLGGCVVEEEIRSAETMEMRLRRVEEAIIATMEKVVPLQRPSPFSKRWWTQELRETRKKVARASRRSFAFREHPHPAHEEYRKLRNKYTQMIKRTKLEYWETWLEEVEAGEVWKANTFVANPASDGGCTRVPGLVRQSTDGSEEIIRDNEGKSRLFHKAFFQKPPANIDTPQDYVYPPPRFAFKPIADSQIDRAIRRLSAFKAPGLSGISNAILVQCRELLVPHLGPIFRATFSLRTYPQQWKTFNTVVLRKPGKKDYSLPNAYRPIALHETLAKVLSSCVKDNLAYETERLGLTPPMQFGCRPGRTAVDSVIMLTSFIKKAWRQGKVVAALFLDVKGAFPSTVIPTLIHGMRMRGVPREYTDWLERKAEGRKTVISFDGYKSTAIQVEMGLDQGCNLSGWCYGMNSADQIEESGRKDELAESFVDDTIYAAAANSVEEVVEDLTAMMTREGGGIDWARTHHCTYEFSKFGFVIFSRWRENDPGREGKTRPITRPPIILNDQVIQATSSHKYLGIILDQELRFKEHTNYAIGKGTQWIGRFKRLAKVAKGMAGNLLRQLYIAVGIPRMLYGAEIWCTPDTNRSGTRVSRATRGTLHKLGQVQRMATLHVTGAMRTTASDLLETYMDLPPMSVLIERICLNTAVRLATLPHSHPLHAIARQSHRFFVKHHRAPIHNIMNCLTVNPREIETILPVRRCPSWTSRVEIIIAKDRAEAKRKLAEEDADVRVYTDGSGIDGGIGAAAVVLKGIRPPRALKYHLGTEAEYTVYSAECVGQVLAVELIRREQRIATALIAIDNQASVLAILGNQPATGHFIHDQFHNDVERLLDSRPELSIKAIWVPGHEGIHGNELADEQAKRAAQGASSEQLPTFLRKPLPKSKAAVKQAARKTLKAKRIALFEKSPRYQRAKALDPSTPSPRFRKLLRPLPRKNSSAIIQLHSNHAPLNGHLHRIKKSDTAACPKCGENETVKHFLTECDGFAVERHRTLGTLGPGAQATNKILGDPKAWPALFQFLNQTGRFAETFGVFFEAATERE